MATHLTESPIVEPGVAGDGSPDRRALVVEDDADIRSLIDLTLSAQGFVIRTAATGRDGLQHAREWEPDLITLDLGLPGIDGLEVCRRVREFSDAYLVVVSARQDGSTAEMTWDVGQLVRFVQQRSSFACGDVLFTGSPAGVGMGTGLFLNPGDVVEATIEGIGTLRNVVSEKSRV